MSQIDEFLFAQYTSYETLDIVLEATAVVFGLLSVWLAKKKSYWCISDLDDFDLNLCLSITQMGFGWRHAHQHLLFYHVGLWLVYLDKS